MSAHAEMPLATYTNPPAGQRLNALMQSRLPQMIEELAALVAIESPSSDYNALQNCANYLATAGESLLGKPPERIRRDGRTHLLWQFGDTPKIVLGGHFDTVHPVGTLAAFPFSIDGDIARGPGACDMKSGIVIALQALVVLVEEFGPEALDGVCLFLNSDEEIASESSLPSMERLSETARIALVFENAGYDGQLKTERRGRSTYEIHITGRSAHAGVEPEKGINALEELCNQFPLVSALSNAELGTTVIPTMASAGTTYNSIPEKAVMHIDVRCRTHAEQQRVHQDLQTLRTVLHGAELEVIGEPSSPPLTASASGALYELATNVWAQLGMQQDLDSVAVGGTSDAGHYCEFGLQVIDGLGAVGGDDHSDREWIHLSSMADRAALTAGMVAALLGLPLFDAGSAIEVPEELV